MSTVPKLVTRVTGACEYKVAESSPLARRAASTFCFKSCQLKTSARRDVFQSTFIKIEDDSIENNYRIFPFWLGISRRTEKEMQKALFCMSVKWLTLTIEQNVVKIST